MTLRCPVCGAPAVLLDSACVFCRTPMSESEAPLEILEYLRTRVPNARVRRAALGRGRVTGLTFATADKRFDARLRGARLVLTPNLPPAQWLDSLLQALSAAAASDAALRARLSKSGWALR